MSEGSSSTQVELRLDWGAWPGRTTSTFGTSRRLHDAGAHHHHCSVAVADSYAPPLWRIARSYIAGLQWRQKDICFRAALGFNGQSCVVTLT